MNIAPVSIRRLLNPLTRPMAMKAPRQDASAAPSSERAEADRAAAGGNREGAELIQKACYLQPLLHPRAALSYTKAQGNGYPTASACPHGNSSFSAVGCLARPGSGQRASEQQFRSIT